MILQRREQDGVRYIQDALKEFANYGGFLKKGTKKKQLPCLPRSGLGNIQSI